MKKLSISILVLLLFFGAYAQKKRVALVPKKSVGTVTLKGKSTYTYYALSETAKTEYYVEGPGQLEINVRVRVEGGEFKSKPFKLKHVRSGKYMEVEQVPELLAGNLTFKSKSLQGAPTKAHKMVIQVPPGKHKYTFFKHKTDQKAHIRLTRHPQALHEKQSLAMRNIDRLPVQQPRRTPAHLSSIRQRPRSIHGPQRTKSLQIRDKGLQHPNTRRLPVACADDSSRVQQFPPSPHPNALAIPVRNSESRKGSGCCHAFLYCFVHTS